MVAAATPLSRLGPVGPRFHARSVPDSSGTTGGWRPKRLLAPVLLTLLVTMGCIDPFLIDGVRTPTNHAPVAEGVEPPPGFAPIPAQFGADCDTLDVRVGRLFDDDLDPLTVRYTLLFKRDGAANGARELLFEDEVVPVENLEGELVYDLTPLELTEALLRSEVGDLDDQVAPGNTLTQLLELRISDGGFVPGDDKPREGAAMVFYSWLIDLDDSDCTVDVP